MFESVSKLFTRVCAARDARHPTPTHPLALPASPLPCPLVLPRAFCTHVCGGVDCVCGLLSLQTAHDVLHANQAPPPL